MRPPHRTRPGSLLLALASLWACEAGCSPTPKPAGDAQTFHPQGIGLDAEVGKLPANSKR